VKIGLIGDTHDGIDAIEEGVMHAFAGVELILHCGDLTTLGLLDRLGAIAPVVAVRSAADPPADPPRLVEGPHVVEAAGLAVGLVNALGDQDPGQLFGRPVDIVVHGGTHAASVGHEGGRLSVNPGSPTLADETTVAVLEIRDGTAAATIVRIG
jgi:putative phosphoesterase